MSNNTGNPSPIHPSITSFMRVTFVIPSAIEWHNGRVGLELYRKRRHPDRTGDSRSRR